MNSKGHFFISMAKSWIRIGSVVMAIKDSNWMVFAGGFLLAEILGIAEEVYDER